MRAGWGVPVDAPANTYQPEPGLNRAFLESLDAHQAALVICRKALAELSLVCPQVDPAADRLLASVTWAYNDEAIGSPVPDEHRLAEYDDSRALFIERVRDEVYGSSQVRRRRSKV